MAWFLVHGIPYQGGGGGGQPTHPIAPGGPPPGIWGPIGNYPDAGFPAPQPPPGYPTHPWVPPYGPTHPIAPGGPPLGIWGPIGNYPDAGFPAPQPPVGGSPSHPIYWPGLPTHPIVIPIPPNSPGFPPSGGMIAVIPAGTTVVSTQDIEVPNPSDPENPFIIPAGTTIVTSQPIIIPTGYNPPGQQPPVATPQKGEED